MQIQQKARIGLSEKELKEEVQKLNELLEIIRWYQYLIYAKIMRALQSKGNIQEDVIQNDANGSAKVALLSIDKSMGAWVELLNQFPSLEDMTLNILADLKKLRASSQKHIPQCFKI